MDASTKVRMKVASEELDAILDILDGIVRRLQADDFVIAAQVDVARTALEYVANTVRDSCGGQ